MNSNKVTKRFIAKIVGYVCFYFFLTALFYWSVAGDWSKNPVTMTGVNPSSVVEAAGEVNQQFIPDMDNLKSVTIMPHFGENTDDCNILLRICEDEKVLWKETVNVSELVSNTMNEIVFANEITDVKNHILSLNVKTQNPGVYLWTGDSVSTGRFDVQVQTRELLVNEKVANGSLVYSFAGYDKLVAYRYIWPAALTLLLFIVVIQMISYVQLKKGKENAIVKLFRQCGQYRYLLGQLVSRDFVVKYKSSCLGVLWSFLNPLITMCVYLVVFSTLFRSDIENFPVYLMSGIIIFNTFTEATNLGLNSIVGNSALITKVYMPKVIYPFSKVLSSVINLCISLVPLMLVMVATGLPMQKSLLLLPLVVLFLMMFSFGISLLLATFNVFFRDTQFLWSVVLMIWNFLSPVFYPESIIAAELMPVYRLNPMYHILCFMRSIVLDGISPAPATYLYCLLTSLIPLVLGLWVFRKKQDEFILHL